VQEAIFAQSVEGVEIEKWKTEKCIRQFVLNVEKNVKSHSSLTRAGQSTAENAGRRKEIQEDSRLS
jgi:hypothetical protein